MGCLTAEERRACYLGRHFDDWHEPHEDDDPQACAATSVHMPTRTAIIVTVTITITITITCGSCLDRKRRSRRHYSPVPAPNCYNFSIAHRAATYTSQVPNKTRPMK
jgi:hypothetical protein